MEIFWIFGGIYQKKFWNYLEDFLEEMFWEKCFWRNFLRGNFWEFYWEDFFGGKFWEESFGRNFLGGIIWEELFVYVVKVGRKEEI